MDDYPVKASSQNIVVFQGDEFPHGCPLRDGGGRHHGLRGRTDPGMGLGQLCHRRAVCPVDRN